MPAPDQSRGQGVAGIQCGGGGTLTPNLDSRLRGKDGKPVLKEVAMMTCKEETVKIRGRNVRLYRGGAGPSLLFLHDAFCPSWLPLHELLAAHFEVLVCRFIRVSRGRKTISINSKKWMIYSFIISISAKLSVSIVHRLPAPLLAAGSRLNGRYVTATV